MAFTYDLTTDAGAVRFRVGDTVEGQGPRPDLRNFSDEEIQHALDAGGGVVGATALLVQTLAVEWSRVPNTTVGDRTQEFSQVSKQYSSQADASASPTRFVTFVAGFVRKDAYSDDQ